MRAFFGRILARLYGYRLITIRPGDIIIVNYQGRASVEQAKRIKATVEEIFGPGVKAAVLDDGLTIDVARRVPAVIA